MNEAFFDFSEEEAVERLNEATKFVEMVQKEMVQKNT